MSEWQPIENMCDELKWQKIETAPKDGERILVVGNFMTHGKPTTRLVYWLKGRFNEGFFDDEMGFVSEIITHWMPLPKPPSDV